MRAWLLVGLLVSALQASADDIRCLSSGRELAIDNAQVLRWKRTTPNQFKARAHVRGQVSEIFRDTSSHDHFELQIGTGADDVIEIVYNRKFGNLPSVRRGDQVEACGEYITSNARTNRYAASPSGAIIHWVHRNPSGRGTESGFVTLNGKVYGHDKSVMDLYTGWAALTP